VAQVPPCPSRGAPPFELAGPSSGAQSAGEGHWLPAGPCPENGETPGLPPRSDTPTRARSAPRLARSPRLAPTPITWAASNRLCSRANQPPRADSFNRRRIRCRSPSSPRSGATGTHSSSAAPHLATNPFDSRRWPTCGPATGRTSPAKPTRRVPSCTSFDRDAHSRLCPSRPNTAVSNYCVFTPVRKRGPRATTRTRWRTICEARLPSAA
jgi:hypothetical protein